MNAHSSAPAITVLMAVRNGAPFLRTSVESILAQSFRDFQFLIVDDASTDGTAEIVRSAADPRIELLCLPGNVGQTAALNIGLRRAASPWIARMDADDFSAPTRLEEQMRALSRFPGMRCVGTAVWEFNGDPRVVGRIVRRPAGEEEIRREALVGRGLIHGSVLIGREALLDVGGYDERYRYAADRELFIRFTKRYKAMNLPEPLLGIRRHPAQDSFSKEAADEYVAIFLRLLASGEYAGTERRTLQEGLAYSYLFRANCRRGEHLEGFRDLLRAFRTHPSRALRTLGGQVVRALQGEK